MCVIAVKMKVFGLWLPWRHKLEKTEQTTEPLPGNSSLLMNGPVTTAAMMMMMMMNRLDSIFVCLFIDCNNLPAQQGNTDLHSVCAAHLYTSDTYPTMQWCSLPALELKAAPNQNEHCTIMWRFSVHRNTDTEVDPLEK